MHAFVGRPLLAAMSAACIAAPAAALPVASTPSTIDAHRAVRLAADAVQFDPVPPGARSTGLSASDIAVPAGAIVKLAEANPDSLLLLDLLTFPYHNLYALSIAAGKAANAGLQLVALPFSVATYVATNRTDEIPGYVATVQKNLAGAVPGIIDTIQKELAYDLSLFSGLGGGSSARATVDAQAAQAVDLAAVDPGTKLLQLATFPYHNAYAVSIAAGKAVNAGLQVVALPFSVATYVATNRTDEIPDYVATVQKNVAAAVPGIVNTTRSEIAYDRKLFTDVFGGATPRTAAVKDTRSIRSEAGVAQLKELVRGSLSGDADDSGVSHDEATVKKEPSNPDRGEDAEVENSEKTEKREPATSSDDVTAHDNEGANTRRSGGRHAKAEHSDTTKQDAGGAGDDHAAGGKHRLAD